jgi:hypothetical protein
VAGRTATNKDQAFIGEEQLMWWLTPLEAYQRWFGPDTEGLCARPVTLTFTVQASEEQCFKSGGLGRISTHVFTRLEFKMRL